jgi:hypothetical protein
MAPGFELTEVTKVRLDQLYPDFKVRIIRVYNDVYARIHKTMKAIEALRSFERQEKLYAIGRAFVDGKWTLINPKAIVTKAPPGMSFHAYGLAVDSGFTGTDPYLVNMKRDEAEAYWWFYGQACQAHGCVWGGDWNGNGMREPNDFDRPHCEMSYGLRVLDCLDLYNYGGIEAVWAELDKIRGVPVGEGWKKNA